MKTAQTLRNLPLTYAVAENNGQDHSYPHSNQSGALPGAMLWGLFELESPPGQAVSGQRACWCGVDRPRRHGVTRGCSAKERCRPCARFKKKVPAMDDKKREVADVIGIKSQLHVLLSNSSLTNFSFHCRAQICSCPHSVPEVAKKAEYTRKHKEVT